MSRDAVRAAARSTREACPASEALTCVIPRILNLDAYDTCTVSNLSPFKHQGAAVSTDLQEKIEACRHLYLAMAYVGTSLDYGVSSYMAHINFPAQVQSEKAQSTRLPSSCKRCTQ